MNRRPLSVAVLVKQVPRFDARHLGANGRLIRSGHDLEMNPYCRRAVSQGIELARSTGGRCQVFTLGPPSAADCLREAVACGADEGVLITDPAFAGSDTLMTAWILAAALRQCGPFDLVLCGRNSVDAETAQAPAQLAEQLGLPMAAGVRELTLDGSRLDVRCEHDDGWLTACLNLPALLTCAERLIRPAKASPEQCVAVSPARIRCLSSADLGAGPWQRGSQTVVGKVKPHPAPRMATRLSGPVPAQVRAAMDILTSCGAFSPAPPSGGRQVADPAAAAPGGPVVAVVTEPRRPRTNRELLGAAAGLAATLNGQVSALTAEPAELATLGRWGADRVVSAVPRAGAIGAAADIAAAFAGWCAAHPPWAVLAPSTMWGREVAGRMAARLGAGLVGDAVDVTVAGDDRLTCWKPALSGSLVAEVTCRSAIQMATVRPGTLPLARERAAIATAASPLAIAAQGRVRITQHVRDDDLDALAAAPAVVAVGASVPPTEYRLLRPLLRILGAELAATRKVTDHGWQPRSRQIGITGRSVAPRLYLAVGSSGAFNHMIGARQAGFILAINHDPEAQVFSAADVGIVADWREAVLELTAALAGRAAPVLATGSVFASW